jgi:hypothetical protein
VPRTLPWLYPCLLLALACAGAPPPLPAGVSATPALGDPIALLVTKLHHAEGAPSGVELRELRAMAVDREPWQPLDPAVAGSYPGEVGVIAGRRCTWREGLRRQQTDRASWFLLDEGVLTAFDHQGFGPTCESRPAFEPAAADQVALEKTLMRYLSQRWPVTEIPGEQRLARGLRLLERGRRDDAAYELYALDRRIDELERRQTEYETPDAIERDRLRREEARLRPLRAQLHHALADHTTKEEWPP